MEKILAWTRQVNEVLDEINEKGRYIVKEEYVRKKNQGISDYYLELYSWFTKESKKFISLEKDFKFPIWLALTESQKLPKAKGCLTFVLEIPRENVIIVDYDKWGYRVNHLYVPDNEEDEKKHLEELKRNNIPNESSLIMTEKGNFYPLLKQKIIKSWDKIFKSPNENMDKNVGTIWEIKKEWIKDIEYYE